MLKDTTWLLQSEDEISVNEMLFDVHVFLNTAMPFTLQREEKQLHNIGEKGHTLMTLLVVP